MARARTITAGALLLLVTIAALAWTWFETSRQRQEVVATLTSEASVLAQALGPGLSAAGSALRELDEVVTARLLDNARLLAELADDGVPFTRIEQLAEANNLEALVLFDARGELEGVFGEDPPPEIRPDIDEIITGISDELILGSFAGEEVEHLRVIARRPRGGAILVQLDPLGARTFARVLGIENLLDRLVASKSVLYLGYRQDPGGVSAFATWDGGPLPPPNEGDDLLRQVRGSSAFEVEVPVESAAGERASLRVGLDGAPLERAAAATMRRTLIVGLVLVALAVSLAGFATVSSLRERERREAAQRLAVAEAGRRRSERLAAAGALTAGLAHEVRSPLNAIGLAAQRLERKLGEDDSRYGLAETVRDEVRRLEAVLREFLELARPVSGTFSEINVGEVAVDVVNFLKAEADEAGVELEMLRGSGRVSGDAEALRRALINLVQNAIQVSSRGGRIVLFVESGRESVAVRVRDEGPGVAPELADRVFDAFVSGRPSGTGLGLALVKRVAEEHGGTVTLENRSGGGADAVLRLPVAK
jgi:signal transduction histidine kinase